MNKYVVMVSLAALLTACGEKVEQAAAPAEAPKAAVQAQQAAPTAEAAAPAVDKAALAEEAKAAVQALGGTLKGELEAAMKAGGPVDAMGICHTKAPEIAKAVSAEKGMEVSRVSLKNRNPVMGQANEWQTAVLNDFETKKAAGEDPATLAYAEVVDNEFRFMKAIPTAAVCLKCHGTELSPAVSAKLTELYPNDKATGYQEGDLRGAFVVVKNLTQ
ncbi:MAG: DUF3365 domain-containing protein [Candidatus Thiothrix putei]|uniref:Tll0287-like domain-containing protein n=2 Tax=Thiothrix TaxID=1030 RepID=A0A1H4GCK7_9GAMM|nr:DUF3365 domain-containing protein [Thiothrix caldifontis]WGZ93115.1 MAG: DUF3365 domain-containing protein [Candidatus Thiothrix putei]SEB07329.1 Protein of unknown function [Thiothrix caldifontis]